MFTPTMFSRRRRRGGALRAAPKSGRRGTTRPSGQTDGHSLYEFLLTIIIVIIIIIIIVIIIIIIAIINVREDSGTGYSLWFSRESYGSKRETTVFHEYLRNVCFVLTESLRKHPEFMGEGILVIPYSSFLLHCVCVCLKHKLNVWLLDSVCVCF